MSFSRRKFLMFSGATAAGVTMAGPLQALYARRSYGQKLPNIQKYGPISPKLPENAAELTNTGVGDLSNTAILELPEGFKYRVFSITGETMDDGQLVPGDHDGMACFNGSGGNYILVRNHELSPGEGKFDNFAGCQAPAGATYDSFVLPEGQGGGGTSTLLVTKQGKLLKHFTSLGGTYRNCAGGPTPWGTWVSCEENVSTPANTSRVAVKHGYNFEVPADANKVADATPLIAMGRFNHEAIAVDPATGYVYETEDRGDSCIYRFKPNKYGNLKSGGELEVLVIDQKLPNGTTNETRSGVLSLMGDEDNEIRVKWVSLNKNGVNIDPDEDTLRLDAQALGGAIFARGEGAWYGDGKIYWVCTSGGDNGNGQVWCYDDAKQTLQLIAESTSSSELDNPDNITVAPFGDCILCEDGGGEQFLVGLTNDGELYKFARNNLNTREFAGACFTDDGGTLFGNIQNPGITFAIWGPFTGSDGEG